MEIRGFLYFLTILAPFALPSQSAKTDTVDDEDTNYGLMLDAGSSGSKLKVYSWKKPTSPDFPPQLTLINDKKFRPPLSSLYGKPVRLGEYLHNILTWAQTKIPSEKHSNTPLYVMATAGMRYLKGRESGHILSSLEKTLRNSSINPFAPIQYDDVSVLSGEEEAVFAWIAINYLLGFFNGSRPPHESVGLLEMGGGSTQIAFIPAGPLYAEEFQVRMAGRVYSVYVQSYLQYGADGIKVKVADALRRRQANSSHVEDPCSLQGDQSKISFGDGTSVRLRGTGSPEKCLEVLEDILQSASGVNCQPKPCSIGRVYQPSVENITFYATQAYGYAPRNLKALAAGGIFNMSFLLSKVRAYCQKPLEEVLKNPKVRAKYASADCLMGLYVPVLLQTYGFNLDTDRIRMTSKVKSFKIDWAMGAMLVKLSDRFTFSMNGNYSVVCPRGSPKNSSSTSPNSSTNSKTYSNHAFMLLFVIMMMTLKKYTMRY